MNYEDFFGTDFLTSFRQLAKSVFLRYSSPSYGFVNPSSSFSSFPCRSDERRLMQRNLMKQEGEGKFTLAGGGFPSKVPPICSPRLSRATSFNMHEIFRSRLMGESGIYLFWKLAKLQVARAGDCFRNRLNAWQRKGRFLRPYLGKHVRKEGGTSKVPTYPFPPPHPFLSRMRHAARKRKLKTTDRYFFSLGLFGNSSQAVLAKQKGKEKDEQKEKMFPSSLLCFAILDFFGKLN